MNVQNFLTEVATLATGGIITVAAGYYLFINDLRRYLDTKHVEAKPSDPKKDEHLQILPLRLQAYERLIVFVDRINPANLLIRVHQQGISVVDLQSVLLNEIRSEYQHNVAQQLYVSAQTWDVVRKLKDDTLTMVSNAARGLPVDSAGVDLSRKILQHMTDMSDNPYDLTLDLIKKDIHLLF
ncbi:DUF7935 family protein [Pedobacter panaciterrae]|jgi:hypothetical protein|uniref:Uncharacterized protein n=1 Tax=Pedobacter panaciterrae TaxID=363849 RepID=A0ABU8NT09_9SPHI|nr:hypothetical protein [uncultured Pedobacter sp.]